jgi:hypothetical protein
LASRDNDRPRKPRKNRKQISKSDPVIKISIIGGGIVALLLGIWIAIILLFFKGGQSDADKVIDGEGWYTASDPDGVFTAYFPGDKPKYEKLNFKPPDVIAEKAGARFEELNWRSQIWARKEGGREYSITLFDVPAHGPMRSAAEKAVIASQSSPQGYVLILEDTVPCGTHQAKRLSLGDAHHGKIVWIVDISPRQVLIVHISGTDTVRVADPKVKAFFENVTLSR